MHSKAASPTTLLPWHPPCLPACRTAKRHACDGSEKVLGGSEEASEEARGGGRGDRSSRDDGRNGPRPALRWWESAVAPRRRIPHGCDLAADTAAHVELSWVLAKGGSPAVARVHVAHSEELLGRIQGLNGETAKGVLKREYVLK